MRAVHGDGESAQAPGKRQERKPVVLEVVQDRFRMGSAERGRVLESLENLDVLRLFTVLKDRPEFDAFRRVEEGNTSRLEMNRTCYEAHETLMKTSPENERRFRDATEFFRKNLGNGEGKE